MSSEDWQGLNTQETMVPTSATDLSTRPEGRVRLSPSHVRLQEIFTRDSRSLEPVQKTEVRFLMKQLQTGHRLVLKSFTLLRLGSKEKNFVHLSSSRGQMRRKSVFVRGQLLKDRNSNTSPSGLGESLVSGRTS